MPGHWSKVGDLASPKGDGGETQHLPITPSPLYSREMKLLAAQDKARRERERRLEQNRALRAALAVRLLRSQAWRGQ